VTLVGNPLLGGQTPLTGPWQKAIEAAEGQRVGPNPTSSNRAAEGRTGWGLGGCLHFAPACHFLGHCEAEAASPCLPSVSFQLWFEHH